MNNNTGQPRQHKRTEEKKETSTNITATDHHIHEQKVVRGVRIYAEAKTRSDEDLQIF